MIVEKGYGVKHQNMQRNVSLSALVNPLPSDTSSIEELPCEFAGNASPITPVAGLTSRQHKGNVLVGQIEEQASQRPYSELVSSSIHFANSFKILGDMEGNSGLTTQHRRSSSVGILSPLPPRNKKPLHRSKSLDRWTSDNDWVAIIQQFQNF